MTRSLKTRGAGMTTALVLATALLMSLGGTALAQLTLRVGIAGRHMVRARDAPRLHHPGAVWSIKLPVTFH
jgi:hypothetical protein